MPKKGYTQTKEHKEKCRLKKLGKDNPMYGKHAKHKVHCQCSFCKAERGELSGKNNYMFGKGYLISGIKNGFYRKKHTPEAKEKNRQAQLGKKHKSTTIEKMKLARMHRVFPKNDTSIEVKMQNILKENNIEFEKHKAIVGQPDIFIKPNICIFCDGDYWHNRPGAQERDEYVNKTLKENGYQILRFWEHEINNNIFSCFCQLQKMI